MKLDSVYIILKLFPPPLIGFHLSLPSRRSKTICLRMCYKLCDTSKCKSLNIFPSQLRGSTTKAPFGLPFISWECRMDSSAIESSMRILWKLLNVGHLAYWDLLGQWGHRKTKDRNFMYHLVLRVRKWLKSPVLSRNSLWVRHAMAKWPAALRIR